MKKLIALITAAVLCCSLSACGEDWANGGDVTEIKDADGNITKYVVTYKDGTVTDFSTDKLPEYSVQETPGGITERFYRDGVIYRETFVGEEGEKETVYDAKGGLATEKFSGTDGTSSEKTYHTNGNLATEYISRADKSREEYIYNEDGVLKEKETYDPRGILNIVKYNDKGVTIYSKTDNTGDGYMAEFFYDDEGNEISKNVVNGYNK